MARYCPCKSPCGVRIGGDCRVARRPLDSDTPMAYNTHMIFLETRVFTNWIVDAMSDEEHAALQMHLSDHPDAGAMIPGCGGVPR